MAQVNDGMAQVVAAFGTAHKADDDVLIAESPGEKLFVKRSGSFYTVTWDEWAKAHIRRPEAKNMAEYTHGKATVRYSPFPA